MGKEPYEIRREIEETRERLGETADAIGYKADVPSRVRDNVNDRIQSAKETFRNGVEAVRSNVAGSTQATMESSRPLANGALQNPLGLAIGSWALGFLIGLVAPATEIERRSLGPLSDKLVEQTEKTGAVEHGKQVLRETVQAATQSAQTHTQQVVEQARQ